MSDPEDLLPLPYYPIKTVGSPIIPFAPHKQLSVTRNAGFPPMNTDVLPIGKMLDVKCPVFGGIIQTWLSVATEAGIPPISTEGSPGPRFVPPWSV